jgi:hypothetical protein
MDMKSGTGYAAPQHDFGWLRTAQRPFARSIISK